MGIAHMFARMLKAEDRNHMIENIASSLYKIPDVLAKKVLLHFNKIDIDLGKRLDDLWNELKKGKGAHEGEKILQKVSTELGIPAVGYKVKVQGTQG
jgi:hypothetical protein